MLGTTTSTVRGPYFDELRTGQVFEAPAVTLSSALATAHHAILGNRLRLTLDRTLAEEVTGSAGLISPAVVWDTAIGQSTVVTQHVKANLFYRGLAFHRHPRIGDTLRTVTTVEALRENTRKAGRAPTGLAVLHMVTTDQHERVVLDFWRCAMLPLSSPEVPEGPKDEVGAVGAQVPLSALAAATADWDLARFRARVPGPHFADLTLGQTWQVQGADVVSSAPELARLTGNIAAVHHDAAAAGGLRLVYGGHTIGLAFHQACRALPAMVTVAGWTGCDHTGPVHEDDALTSTVEVLGLDPLPGRDAQERGGGLVRLRVLVHARKRDGALMPVLDWVFTAVLA